MQANTTYTWLDIAKHFFCNDVTLYQFANQFRQQAEAAQRGETSSLSALRSYLPLPTGQEKGTYIAVDFGGTNVRAARIRLLGGHCHIVEKKVSRPLRLAGKYDYTTAATTAAELFDFIADCVGEAAGGNRPFYLGHTFSFGVQQRDLHDALFSCWAKEIAVQGAEGHYVNAMLRDALVRRGLDQIEPVALVNDTTALLAAAAYQFGCSVVGVICGTGFNMCYYEPAWQMIVNLEAGDYSGVKQTIWDERVDAQSLHPGVHRLEKMISGAYIGEIYRQALMTYFQTDTIPKLTAKDMGDILVMDNLGLTTVQIRLSRLLNRIIQLSEIEPVRNLAAAIFARTAELSGAAAYGMVRHIYPGKEIPAQMVTVEGSVLQHTRGGLLMFDDAMYACAAFDGWPRQEGIPVESLILFDGPAVGAAAAAALATGKD